LHLQPHLRRVRRLRCSALAAAKGCTAAITENPVAAILVATTVSCMIPVKDMSCTMRGILLHRW
jgi:hypothetical protein